VNCIVILLQIVDSLMPRVFVTNVNAKTKRILNEAQSALWGTSKQSPLILPAFSSGFRQLTFPVLSPYFIGDTYGLVLVLESDSGLGQQIGNFNVKINLSPYFTFQRQVLTVYTTSFCHHFSTRFVRTFNCMVFVILTPN
jgi:hypothetical protein